MVYADLLQTLGGRLCCTDFHVINQHIYSSYVHHLQERQLEQTAHMKRALLPEHQRSCLQSE